MLLVRLLIGMFAIKNSFPNREAYYPFQEPSEPDCISAECDPPNVTADTDRELFNITKSFWVKEKLYELESFKITYMDKINLAKEVLMIFDDDILNAMGHNVMAGGLLDDWDHDI